MRRVHPDGGKFPTDTISFNCIYGESALQICHRLVEQEEEEEEEANIDFAPFKTQLSPFAEMI